LVPSSQMQIELQQSGEGFFFAAGATVEFSVL